MARRAAAPWRSGSGQQLRLEALGIELSIDAMYELVF
jgi:hypothetical protein